MGKQMRQDLEKVIKSKNDHIVTLKAQLESAAEDLHEAEVGLATRGSELKHRQDERERLLGEVADKDRQLAALGQTLAGLKASLAQRTQAAESADLRTTDLSEDLERLTRLNGELEQKAAELERQLASRVAERDAALRQAADDGASVARHAEQLATLEDRRREQDQQLAQVQAALAEWEEAVAAAAQEKAALERRVSQLLQSLRASEDSLAELQREDLGAEKKHGAVVAKLKSVVTWSRSMRRLADMRLCGRQRSAGLEAELGQVREELQRLTAGQRLQLEALQLQLTQLGEEKTQLGQRHKRILELLKEESDRANELTADKARLTRENSKLAADLAEQRKTSQLQRKVCCATSSQPGVTDDGVLDGRPLIATFRPAWPGSSVLPLNVQPRSAPQVLLHPHIRRREVI